MSPSKGAQTTELHQAARNNEVHKLKKILYARQSFFEKMLNAFLVESYRRLNQNDANFPTLDVFYNWFSRDGQGASNQWQGQPQSC